jgi:hypothetical protein
MAEQTTIEKLCNPLDKADIELRIGTTSAKGFSLLAYKTARTDVKRLNEVCGLNWCNSYFYDAKDILSCSIAIKSEDEWVSRTDVGTESNTEKEKGSYSDAFKRAGFKWGIGIELYQSPFIWVNWEMTEKEYGGKKKYEPKGFYSSKLDIQEYKVIEGVPYFKIIYEDKVIFDNLPTEKKAKGVVTAQRKEYTERLECLGRCNSKELWDKVKDNESIWTHHAYNTYGTEYGEQMENKFAELKTKYGS